MAEHLVGVTIGIGEEYARLAQIAARRMRKHTGLNVHILCPGDLESCDRPSDLKFRLFEKVNAENILYFDADVFCLRLWNPREFCDRAEWIAVRGWWFDPWVQRTGPTYGFGEDEFNGGMFICNRNHHARLLYLAQQLQPEDNTFHGLTSSDEIALNIARTILQIPVHFLDRRFNWIQYGRGNLAGHTDVILAHACDRRLRPLYAAEQEPLVEHGSPAERGLIPEDLAGRTFIYERHGYDRRPLHLRRDGTIGEGGAGAERFFFTTRMNGNRRLVLGSEYDETCLLTEERDGSWRGRWSHHEQMPITLTPHRAQVIVDLLRQRFGTKSDLVGAEIGVYQGETSSLLLRELTGLKLYLVDPWRAAVNGSCYWLTNSGDARTNQRMFDDLMRQTTQATAFAGGRRMLVPSTSIRAAKALPDGLDFVFIDAGDHGYVTVTEDLNAWRGKLAKGGLMCGHDYDNPKFPSVKEAVDEFASRHGLCVATGPDMVWYFLNP